MYILKNAWLSIKRTKGRNILIGIILLLIAVTSSIALAIKSSANELVNTYTIKNNIIGTISFNRQKMMGKNEGEPPSMEDREEIFNNISSLTLENIEEYADSEYVTDYYYSNSVSIDVEGITAVTSTSDTEESNMSNRFREMQRGDGDFSLIGYNNLSAMSDFINGTYTIDDGSVFEDFEGNDCIISNELAIDNDLSVGDTITLVSPYNDELTYNLIIYGIYSDNDTTENQFSIISNSANKIITNVDFVNSIINDDTENYNNNFSVSFVIKNENSIELFQNELESKGLDEYYSLNTNLDEVTSELKPIENVSSFASTFLIMVIIIGSIVLFIINLINIRERKYEIGVLRTIGMKKKLVISQFCLELFIVAFASITIGTAIGFFTAKPVSNYLLSSEITSMKEESSQIGNNFGMNSEFFNNKERNVINRNVDYIEELDVNLNYKILLEIIFIGLGLTLISSSAALINISRFSPLKILKERS